MKLLIKNGRLVDPASHLDATRDILLEDDRVKKIDVSLKVPAGVETIDAAGLVVVPGFIDMHTHLREPGGEHKESIESGCRAAAAGGYTTIACMPNTDPVNDNRSVTEFIVSRAHQAGLIRVLPIAAISRGRLGENLTEMADLVAGGAVAFSDDGQCVMKADLIRKALEYTKMLGVPIIEHPEDHSISADGQVNEGFISYKYGLRGILNAAEEVIVSRDLILQGRIGSRLHLTHLSTAGSIDLVRNAKKAGVKVTVDVTPHHLLLNEEKVSRYETVYKVKPPLRTEADRQALIEALLDGTVDCIATDHAPHTRDEKDREFEYAPFGMIGLETAFSVLYDRLVGERRLSFSRLIELLSLAPARILGQSELGRVVEGLPADLTLLNLDQRFRIDAKDFHSKSNNSPFIGWEGKGAVALTIAGGKVVYRRPA
ncbi:MAG TPA: dihydroorotase [Candidatus Aminicenantes bacterium]|nr:dihydroorotase [Candidatus Aminicenantes bacterium]